MAKATHKLFQRWDYLNKKYFNSFYVCDHDGDDRKPDRMVLDTGIKNYYDAVRYCLDRGYKIFNNLSIYDCNTLVRDEETEKPRAAVKPPC